MNTREAILDFLDKHPYAHAEELSQTLQRTRANIQYHLKQMEKEGVLTQVPSTGPHSHRGRPLALYSLQIEDRNNIPHLAEAIFKILISQEMDHSSTDDSLREIAVKLVSLPPSTVGFTHRINQLIKELAIQGYQPRWEAHSEGPVVMFRNCPYWKIVQKIPELCRMDALILEINLRATIHQSTKINYPDCTACQFQIKRYPLK